MCPSGATCLSADRCFSEIALSVYSINEYCLYILSVYIVIIFCEYILSVHIVNEYSQFIMSVYDT